MACTSSSADSAADDEADDGPLRKKILSEALGEGEVFDRRTALCALRADDAIFCRAQRLRTWLDLELAERFDAADRVESKRKHDASARRFRDEDLDPDEYGAAELVIKNAVLKDEEAEARGEELEGDVAWERVKDMNAKKVVEPSSRLMSWLEVVCKYGLCWAVRIKTSPSTLFGDASSARVERQPTRLLLVAF